MSRPTKADLERGTAFAIARHNHVSGWDIGCLIAQVREECMRRPLCVECAVTTEYTDEFTHCGRCGAEFDE